MSSPGPEEIGLADVADSKAALCSLRAWHFPPKLDSCKAISQMGSLHIFIHKGDWQDKVKIKGVDNIGKHPDHDC